MCIYSQLPAIMLIHCVELYLDYENIERFHYLGPNYAVNSKNAKCGREY